METKPAALETTLVQEFVIAAHGNLERTQELLAQESGLINACWDWGGGDFETALGGAALQSSEPETAFSQLAASAGLAGTELPSEMAFINEVLDALPDELCNAFLVNYFNDLYV
ncbi:MAG: hypothetical protein ACXW4M_02090 [Anaerolineales bacterium]